VEMLAFVDNVQLSVITLTIEINGYWYITMLRYLFIIFSEILGASPPFDAP